ncbi:MAG: chromate resistance protein [Thaumarchaeota archaeon]|nr:chromate resistance protein [Nitrososphaerota archaeon]
MKWVTREKAKVDRIACPWLIKRFVDPAAEFLFVPAETVKDVAKREGAIPFDAAGVELTHYWEGDREYVSFDAIIRKYGLSDPALLELARIVRGADAKISDPPPESAGLEAAALGFRQISRDDFENMRLQFPAYDALYEYCAQKLKGTAKLDYTRK